jgi:hypothetical protein
LDLAEMDIKKALEIDPDNRYAFGLMYDLQVIYAMITNLVPKGQC